MDYNSRKGYSINGRGLEVLENWREEYGKPKVDRKKLRGIQKDLYNRTKDFEKEEYSFSVFISHSYLDIEVINKICNKMMENNILPRFYFQKKSHKSIRNKLCDMINDSDLLLIYYSENSISSQMTNNEIGFVVGKSYYNNHFNGFQKEFIYKIRDNNLPINKLNGFFTKGDEILTISEDTDDIQDLIDELKSQYQKNQEKAKKDGNFTTMDLLGFMKLTTLKKMAKPTSIRNNQSIDNLREDLSKYEPYSYDDYLYNMEISELKKVCKHFGEATSGKKLEMIICIKKHFYSHL